MSSRLALRLIIPLAGLLLIAGNAGCTQGIVRDWNAYPAVTELDTASDIYALGDIHGDYDRTVALLVSQGILKAVPAQPQDAEWAAGSAVLVVVGDVIDRWNQGLKALTLLQALTDSAAKAGGRVIVTLGNHEAEFLADPSSSKASDFAMELSSAGISPADVAAGRHPVGQYLRTLPVAARVRDWFFCHAGNTAGRTLAQLSVDIQGGLEHSGYGASVLANSDSLLEAHVEPTPWWESQGTPAATLQQYAQALGVAHIVMGHYPGQFTFSDGATRTKGSLFPRFGTLFLIDAGMSRGVDYGKGALLHVVKSSGVTTATALYTNGAMSQLFQG